jgi:hypothetical protein
MLTRSYGDDSSSEFTSEGDLDLQAALVQQLEIQINNEALKEEIREDLKLRVERMKELGEQVGGLLVALWQHPCAAADGSGGSPRSSSSSWMRTWASRSSAWSCRADRTW